MRVAPCEDIKMTMKPEVDLACAAAMLFPNVPEFLSSYAYGPNGPNS